MKTHNNTLVFFAILIAIINLVYASYSFSNLPATIPIHFGIDGKPNGWGEKYTIFFIPLINLALVGFMASVRKNPFSYLNLPITKSNNNLEERVKLGRQLLDLIIVSISALFFFIELHIVKSSHSPISSNGIFVIIVTIVVAILGLSAYYTNKINKLA
ncbi:hypothetical protein GCM10011514_05930 [Emticicia aquatilis]|uniref:DUF1648 domain-containing protein n=1 Tax=Emticicia aquatilis TaxID=1537369 RepID=A0A916YH50_9BACT|nr:DUF1648 domain-containing protein [Emticicia aquatilis]GGD44713.1 hypothetical protein GCM10011514_05930 [Emticicia aquatilis]